MTDCGTEMRTWSELRQSVRELRRQMSGPSSKVPGHLSFRPLKGNRFRVYFLSCPSSGRETSLFYVDVPGSFSMTDRPPSLNWQALIEPTFQAVGRCSKEEQLMWERKRMLTWGITSYELHPESGKFVFPAAGSLYCCMDPASGNMNGSLYPKELKTNCIGSRLNPQMCPHNPDLVAFVCCGDIWVCHAPTGNELRLTHTHKGRESPLDNPISAGIPSYVTQEEFDRYQGFWWQPASKDGVYRILYEEVDESDVHILRLPSSNIDSADLSVEEFRFPRAGTPNSKSFLKMIQFNLDKSGRIVDPVVLELDTPLNFHFSWMEYLVYAGWTEDGSRVWVQLLDRTQQRLELVLIALEAFSRPDVSGKRIQFTNAPLQVIYSYKTDFWVNASDTVQFLPSEDPSQIRFLWLGEETGYRHLYVVTSLVHCLPPPNKSGDWQEHSLDGGDYLKPMVLNKVALTSGDWEVIPKAPWVNLERGLVYFTGLMDSPLEKHLYVVSFAAPGQVRRLTSCGHSHSLEFSQDCTMFASNYSDIENPQACELFRVVHVDSSVDGVILVSAGHLLEPSGSDSQFRSPEIFTYKMSSSDETLHAMLFRPHDFEPGKEYPTVLNIYGGPEVQLVSNSYKGMRQLRMHMLAAHDFCVVVVDSRGSKHRGLRFEGYLKGRMGTVEIEDQLEVLEWLAEKTGCIDTKRLAIHGWSYGGYLSLLALAKYPQQFKIAIAGAPVTSWDLYDTGYTERYMGLPQENPDGYRAGSVLSYAHHFPDQENRLLIIHGLIDENVHFLHTSQLINALVKLGKPYQLQIYPNERHSLRHLDASEHYETALLSFLKAHL